LCWFGFRKTRLKLRLSNLTSETFRNRFFASSLKSSFLRFYIFFTILYVHVYVFTILNIVTFNSFYIFYRFLILLKNI
jgi:hypothetical protein